MLSIVAIVLALGGSAIASGRLTLGSFTDQSRDTLAGTGVIQFASQAATTGQMSNTVPQTFSVKCELSKKATSGGFKWTGTNPPQPGDYKFLDAYPNGGGYIVRLYVLGPSAAAQPLTVYSNCVKSRAQRGLPPS